MDVLRIAIALPVPGGAVAPLLSWPPRCVTVLGAGPAIQEKAPICLVSIVLRVVLALGWESLCKGRATS